MTPEQTGRWIRELIRRDRLIEFYLSPEWRRLRASVLAECCSECQLCRRRGFYAPADTVHHVQFVRKHPELALSRTYRTPEGKEAVNLLPVCHKCHEEIHRRRKSERPPVTPERW